MTSRRDWASRIGRRVRLRDLHVLFAVVQHGSMARAGAHLGMSQSAVSQAVAALERALEVPLLDRTPRGAAPTPYGAALLRRGQVAFDELRSGVNDIAFLKNSDVGEVRIACTESVAAGILPAIIERFSRRYPKVRLTVYQTTTHLLGFAALEERTADVVLTLLPKPFEKDLSEHLDAEVIFRDRICLVASAHSPWARRRKMRLADVTDAPLISPASDTPGGAALEQAFSAAGLPAPNISVRTFSVHLRSLLSMRGRFMAVLPISVLRFNPDLYALKELPFDLSMPELPILVVRLKNRTLSVPVDRFIDCARDIVRRENVGPRRPSTGVAATGRIN